MTTLTANLPIIIDESAFAGVPDMEYGRDFTVAPWRIGWRHGHCKRKNNDGKLRRNHKSRIMHPNSLKNLLLRHSNRGMKNEQKPRKQI